MPTKSLAWIKVVAEILRYWIRFEHQPAFEGAAPVERQLSPHLWTEDVVPMRAATTRQREQSIPSQYVDHVHY
ncbi:hypothetical protein [Paraburkholderia atlantica]|uniref:hypothetical protein n=1 Tax=Paraburkholderia atlantica TaxID=2654982 RepID=UPI00128D31C2|nr:hypothetical protein [Paraburkholderia atlantica]